MYFCNCRCCFLILSPTPRTSSARKALFQMVSANPDARSDGDDSSTRLLTPFLYDGCGKNNPRSRSILIFQQRATRLRVCVYLCSPRAAARPASPAPTMTTSSAASIAGKACNGGAASAPDCSGEFSMAVLAC